MESFKVMSAMVPQWPKFNRQQSPPYVVRMTVRLVRRGQASVHAGVGDMKLHDRVLNFSADMQALATHLNTAATGALTEANVFLTKRQSI